MCGTRTGDDLPSHFALDGIEVAIVIEDDGAAYPLTIDPLLTSPVWTAESDQAFTRFGRVVATAGDVNGDGYSDVIVGADQYDNGETDEGRAFVYHGSAAGLSATPAWTAESNQASALFGFSVATAGDVNGDGFADVIVGALYFDNGQTDEGRAFVYLGSAAGLAPTAAWTAESDQASAQFGWSVATAGDVNGDGFADVIVGANQFDNGRRRGSRVRLPRLGVRALARPKPGPRRRHRSVRPVRHLGGDGGRRERRRLRRRHRRRRSATATGRRTKGGRSSTTARPAGLAATAAWTAESDQARRASAGRWRRRAT